MKTKTTATLIVLLLIISQVSIYAQKPPAKFGKIDESEFENKFCPIDSNAHAFFIFDYGTTNFKYNTAIESKGFQLHFDRHLRIKIVDNEGFSWGDVRIALFQNNNGKEEISSIRAYTYNFTDGKIEKSKLDRSDLLTEETSENWQTLKFAMPNIKEGSIIEIEYTIVSDFLFNLQEWQFQRSIPVLHSEYFVSIPEYFNYNQSQFGYFPVSITTGSRRNKIIFSSTERTGDYIVKSEMRSSEVEFEEKTFHYLANNITSFPKEQFLRTGDNYMSKVDFELQYTKFPDQPLKYYTTSWEEVDEMLLDSEYFGKALNRVNHLKDDIVYLSGLGLENEALLSSALHQIQKKIHWNGNRNKYLKSTLNSACKDGEGNSADVNLNLVALLRELGFKSNPVVLSTQDNGIIHPSHPSLSRFNYVIAMVELGEKTYLLDATDPNSMLNLIPIRCLNDKGRVIGNQTEKWINLMDYKPYAVNATYLVSIDSAFNMSGKVSKQLSEYGAFDYKSKLAEANDVHSYLTELEETGTGFKIENLKVKGLEENSQNLSFQYNMVQKKGLNGAGTMIYFSPTLDPFFKDNPFKLEKREFPVEFDYPYIFQNNYSYLIPNNLEITELPDPLIVKLPENNGIFHFQIQSVGPTLNVSLKLVLSKSIFLPDEYESLKSFFQYVIDKQNELIILKAI